MKDFDVQGIRLDVPRRKAFQFVADPQQLPRWTNAFASVSNGSAVMRTPAGEVTVRLEVRPSQAAGTVDWTMRFPDGSTATAYSRIVEMDMNRSVFSFVLTPPPVPLEQLEGALEAQSRILTEELQRLKEILEHDD